MVEFKIYNNELKEFAEEESVVRACKKAKEINGFVGVIQVLRDRENYGKIKEIIQGETLEYLASKASKNAPKEELSREEEIMVFCCICSCEIDLTETRLTEDTGEPICDNCHDNYAYI